ncbi:MAG: ZIP family metal transporter [Candidatus Gottesmanbacteria bacterium]|nr:ZIP family metal transporter [Candidatus Gottesmanbacteria bacterium]
MVFVYALSAVTIVSLLSLLGAVFIVLQRKILDSITTYLLAFSSGILLGTTFYDLIPEGYNALQGNIYTWVIVGLVAFFILEKFIHWHSHVEEMEGGIPSKKHVAYLTLIGDGVHNFLDGAIIGVTFLTSVPLGVATTIAVIAHEIPHELGDFFLLIYGGFNNKKALWYNFLSALTAVVGTVVIFVFSKDVLVVSPYLIGFAAGNFLYIAASDLIPELHEKRNVNISIMQTIFLIIGIVLMWIVSTHLKG